MMGGAIRATDGRFSLFLKRVMALMLGFAGVLLASLASFSLTLLYATDAHAARYAAIVVDHNTGKVLYSRHADAPRYPASLTKIMTLYLVFKELKAGKISHDSKLTVTTNATMQQPSKLSLKAGSKITVRDAIRALVTKSANDVAVVIAENFAGSEQRFAEVMTVTAAKLGMTKTVFRNASGLPDSNQITTARDMSILSRRIIDDFPKLYKFFKLRRFTYRGKRYRNHNGLLFNYKGTDGIKTGYTRASGFNLAASARRGKKHLVAVVMGGRSAGKRNAKMRYLLNKAWRKASRTKKRIEPKVAPQLVAAAQPAVRSAPVTAPKVASVKQAVSYQTAELRPTIPPGEEKDNAIATGPYHVQIGAFETQREANARLATVHSKAQDILRGHLPITMEVPVGNRNLVRARFVSFSKSKARQTCKQLKRLSIQCLAVQAK